MSDEPTNPAPEQPVEPAAPEAPVESAAADPWADPDAARKEIEKLRRESAAYRTRAKELEPLAAKARDAEEAQKTEAERLTEQLTAAQERAAKSISAAVAAKVEALAAGQFADPEDAAGALDLTTYVDEDGVIDSAAIKRDLAALLERKPHWAKAADPGPRRPAPDRTQGSSGNQARTSNDPAESFAAFIKGALNRR